MISTKAKQYDGAYILEDEEGDYFGIALRPSINQKTRTIEWDDTGKVRSISYDSCSIYATEGSELPVAIEFRISDSTYYFKIMTKEVYEGSVIDHVIAPPRFLSDKDVQDYYLTHEFIHIDV